jgi:hypothetical protein
MGNIKRGIAAVFSLAMPGLYCALANVWEDMAATARRAAAIAAQTLIVAAASALPLISMAQTGKQGESAPVTDRWRWATVDQAELQVVALDARRQQVVVKAAGAELAILRQGTQVPRLSVFLETVSGNTAVFRPMKVPGPESVDRIEITSADGRQATRKIQSAAPARSMTSGWMVVSP